MIQENLTKLSVLVVEDDALIRRLVVRAAGAICGNVTSAENGSDAIAQLEGSTFDVVITDLKMPGESGMAVLQCARSAHPGVALIVITGYASGEDEKQAKRLRAFLLRKPFGLHAIRNALQESLRQRTES